MARPMTAQEKQQFQQIFPNLDVNAAVVTGEATTDYNCISWTVGVTNAWLWPGSTIQDFDAFYNQHGFWRASGGSIAAWGDSFAAMTHGSVSGPGHGPRWESKCGSLLRIQHGLNELDSPSYGHIVAYYSRRGIWWWFKKLFVLGKPVRREPMPARVSEAARARLEAAARALEPELKERFERLFEAWRKSWNAPEIRIQSDPAAVRRSPEFEQLVALGPAILPAVAEKLADPANFFALQLFEALQPGKEYLIAIDPRASEIMEGEQGRAARTAEAFARRLRD
ncbi:MAG TPA: hypothetical protein VGW40_14490 [Allosphingosinicella sp.]|nr:hypothetical protein [Allosphingosinicella sp.]